MIAKYRNTFITKNPVRLACRVERFNFIEYEQHSVEETDIEKSECLVMSVTDIKCLALNWHLHF